MTRALSLGNQDANYARGKGEGGGEREGRGVGRRGLGQGGGLRDRTTGQALRKPMLRLG